MKKLLLIACLLASSTSYCLTLNSIKFYNLDTVQYNNTDNFAFYGDSAILNFAISYSNPGDLNKNIVLDINGSIIYSGTINDYLSNNGWVKFKFPTLPFTQIGTSKYIYQVNFNGTNKTYIRIYPSRVNPSRGVDVKYISNDIVSLGDSAYVAIQFSSIGQWTSSDILYVTIQGSGNQIVFSQPVLNLDKIKRNNDSTTWLKFKIPTSLSLGMHNYLIEIVGSPNYASTTKPTFEVKETTTALINNQIEPLTNISIHYYNIQGLEIEKPIEGLYIWKTESGESGKILVE